jgi:hypothetical protein
MPSKHDRNFLEAFLTNTEAVIDVLIENEAVRAVPVVGTAFKVCKGLDDARSRALAAKLAKFLTQPAMRNGATAEKLRRKIQADPVGASRIGENLFLVIERLTDLEKPLVLARAYAAYLDDDLSASDLKRIARAIDISFSEDLFAFLDADESELNERMDDPMDTKRPWVRPLESSGLTSSNVGRAPPGAARTSRAVTPLGHTLRTVWRKYETEA